MNPSFSIIIPVYNVAPYLCECLNSILNQTFQEWEAICVDDGSTDRSGEILDDYCRMDSRFKVIHKENGGVSSSRNVGIDSATGDWIAFVDADDVWAPWTLEYVSRAIKEDKDVDLVRFDTLDFPENGNHPWDVSSSTPYVFEIEDISERIDAMNVTNYFGGKTYRRDIVSGVRFSNYTVGEDLLFLMQCMNRARKQVHVKACCYGYRQRFSSASHSYVSTRKMKDMLGYIPRILESYDSSSKSIDKFLWRIFSNQLMEQFFVSFIKMDSDVRQELWSEWMFTLGNVLRLKKLQCFQKFRIKMLLIMPILPVAYILCYIPYYMKVKYGLKR